MPLIRIFNREWAKKLEAKREEEFQHEKVRNKSVVSFRITLAT